ncbi:MAG TPA: PD-(D/E)XK nuclease family protein [Candidatus Bathyarchaeia archaeon]|nr:PD-(D/E)XK nuclease family protein [Candidatus Bathyarchaeia archaeon]
MITAIHQSSLNTFLRCAEQFRRVYVEGERIPPGIAAGRGTGIHKANEINLIEKIKTGESAPLTVLQDAARDSYIHAFKDGVFIPKDKLPEKGKLLNEGLNDCMRGTKLYRAEVAPLIHPTSIEEPFNIDAGLELPLAGRMDYQEEPRVGDLKTTTKKWGPEKIKEEIQVPFYSYVYEKEKGVRPEFRYDVLIVRRGKTGPTSEEYQPLTHTCTNADYGGLFAKLELFIKSLKAGIFPPTHPTNWICDRSWCGFWQTCKFVGNSAPKKWI